MIQVPNSYTRTNKQRLLDLSSLLTTKFSANQDYIVPATTISVKRYTGLFLIVKMHSPFTVNAFLVEMIS